MASIMGGRMARMARVEDGRVGDSRDARVIAATRA
jgi:hypothetical protein